MRTLVRHPDFVDTEHIAEHVEPAHAVDEQVEAYVPPPPEAPRGARRIAMETRRTQDRHLGGW